MQEGVLLDGELWEFDSLFRAFRRIQGVPEVPDIFEQELRLPMPDTEAEARELLHILVEGQYELPDSLERKIHHARPAVASFAFLGVLSEQQQEACCFLLDFLQMLLMSDECTWVDAQI